jgi:hypothetical protein
VNGKHRWALALAAWALPLSAQGLAYEGGVSATTGRYFFDTRTTSFSLSSGLAYTTGRLTLRVALPIVAQNTPLVTASGAGGLPSGGSFGGMVSDSGGHQGMRRRGLPVGATARRDYAAAVGDPVAQAAVQLVTGPRFTLRAGAAVKAPLADTATYGTGRWDAGVSLGATGYFGSAVFLSVDAAWWHLGDLPALDFRDPIMGSVSVDRMLGEWALGVVASGGTTAVPGYEAPALIGMSLSHVTARGGWGVTASAGLTETAPDLFVGVSWRVRL